MATYHLRTKNISRGKAQSAIAAAAYRSGKALTDERTGEVKDFTTRRDHVSFEGIFAPRDAPDWARDRQQLWNHVEQAEKRKDARLARELEISLPHELTDQQREWLVKDFVRENFVRRGFVVDVALHSPGHKNDSRNFHAHLMVTTRQLEAEGFVANKDRSANSKAQLQEWREKWADLANRHLERHGHEARIDHRSHEARGIEAEPTRYEGPKVTEMARRGQDSDRRRENELIRERNAVAAEVTGVERPPSAQEMAPRSQIPEREPINIHEQRPAAAAEITGTPRPPTMRERMEQHMRETAERMRAEIEAERQRQQAEAERKAAQPEKPRPKQNRELKEAQREDREALKAEHAGQWAELKEQRRQLDEKARRAGDEWTTRGGMAAQQEEALSRTSAAKESREQRAEERRTAKAEDYYRNQLQNRPAPPLPRIERLSENPALIFQKTAGQLLEQAKEPQPLKREAAPSPQPSQLRQPERGGEQRQREEARRSVSAPETPLQRGPEREKTESQVERQAKAGSKEMTERQRELMRFYSGRQEHRSRDDDGGRERD